VKKFVNLIFFSFLIAGIYVFYLEPKINNFLLPDISRASAYEIVSTSNFSFPGRKRLSWNVSTSAITPEQIKQTAQKAAIELQKSSGAAVVDIFVARSPLDQDGLAMITYAPDGKGYSGDQNWKWDWRPLHDVAR
jgi:hypothetical protein